MDAVKEMITEIAKESYSYSPAVQEAITKSVNALVVLMYIGFALLISLIVLIAVAKWYNETHESKKLNFGELYIMLSFFAVIIFISVVCCTFGVYETIRDPYPSVYADLVWELH